MASESPYRNMRRRIYTHLSKLGHTQASIADMLGCSEAAVSNTLNGNGHRQSETAQWRRRIFKRLKQLKGCEQCGYDAHAEALDWDHIDPDLKTAAPSGLISSTCTAERIMKELDNCRVLCANCHRIHSYEQRNANETHRLGED